MRSNVILVAVDSAFVHREDLDVPNKMDADYGARELAAKWGMRPMKSHQTTVAGEHFVTVFGAVRARARSGTIIGRI